MSTILEYPHDSGPTEIVTLPSPNWNDEETIDDGVIPRHSRGGDLHAFRPSGVVRTRTITIDVVGINQTGSKLDIDDLVAFLTTTAGLKIKITDAESRVVSGFVTTPILDIITVRDTSPGSYDVHLEILEDPE